MKLKEKINCVYQLIQGENFEDAAAHLCDLLEMCRLNITNNEGMQFSSLEWLVKKYGKNPKAVER